MRIKPLALASVCMLALSSTTASAALNSDLTPEIENDRFHINVPLSSADVLAHHGMQSLDVIKNQVDHNGQMFVADTTNGVKSDVTMNAAAAQMPASISKQDIGGISLLLVLIAGGFMWLSLMHQRREQ